MSVSQMGITLFTSQDCHENYCIFVECLALKRRLKKKKKSCLVVIGNRFVRSVERAWGEEAEEWTLRSGDKSVRHRVSWPSQAPLTAPLCLSPLALPRVDSIMLVEEGFSVTSVDASDKMLKYALKERWNRRHEPAFDKWGMQV